LDGPVGAEAALGNRGGAKSAQQRGQAFGRDLDPAAVGGRVLREAQANLSGGDASPISSVDGADIVGIGGRRPGFRPNQACCE
jgi:hypothetical protein